MTNILQIHKLGMGTLTYEQWKVMASDENPNVEQRNEAKRLIKESEDAAAKIPQLKEIKRNAER